MAILLSIGPTSADVPAITLKAPTVAPDAGHSVVGVVLSPDMRNRLRRQGGSLTVQWSSSRGRGCLTRAAGDNRMDATFDLKGLDPGTVTMTASLTTGGQTFDSTPVGIGLFSVDVQPANATVTQGQTFIEAILTSPDTAALTQVTWQFASSVDGTVLSSGEVPVSAFGSDGQGHLAATQAFLAPADFTGIAILTITAAAASVDAFGTPITVTASSAATITVQPAMSIPLTLAFTTPAAQGFPAGATADIGFTLQTPDPATTQASFTVFDAQKSVVAHGPAMLTPTGATSASGVAAWAVPSNAGGQYTVIVFASQGTQSVTGSLPIDVVPAAGPALAIAQPGPITVTAGEAATVGFTLTGVTSLTGATLQAVFTDRATGAVLSGATIDPATLVQQPGGFAGSFTFTFPAASAALDTTLTITYLENGAPVASGAIAVLVQPAAFPIVVSIGSAPSQAAAGTSPPLTIDISGVTVAQMSTVSWSLKDGLGSTVATANVSPSQFVQVGTHLEATVPMTLSPAIAPGTYTLEAAMTTTSGATFTASQPIAITEGVSVRFVQAASTIDEGVEQSFQVLLRPRVDVGFAKWLFTNGVGVVAPGFPSGTVAGSDLIAVTDGDGTPAWLISVRFTVPSGTVSVPTLVHFVLSVFDPAGRPLVTTETAVLVQPASVVQLTSVQPSEAFPGMRLTLTGFGFSPVLGQNSVVTAIQGQDTTLPAESVSADRTSITVTLPAFHPVGEGTVRVVVSGNESQSLPLRVWGATEVAWHLDFETLRRTASPGTTPEGRRRLEEAYRFYDRQIYVQMIEGRFGGRFGQMATQLREYRRLLERAQAAGTQVDDLVTLAAVWAALLDRAPEVDHLDFTPSPRERLITGTSRVYRVLLLDARRQPISPSSFPPALAPRILEAFDARGNARVTVLEDALSFRVDCDRPYRTVVTGKVLFASKGTGTARSTPPGTWMSIDMDQDQGPPTPRRRGVPISECFTYIKSLTDPDPDNPRWLPEGPSSGREGAPGNVHEFDVWWTTVKNQDCVPDSQIVNAEILTVYITDITNWRGVCGNNGSSLALDLDVDPSSQATWEVVASGDDVNHTNRPQRRIVLRTKAPQRELQCVPLKIRYFDFGASSAFQAVAGAPGSPRCERSPVLRIPWDRDLDGGEVVGDGLPDAWERTQVGFDTHRVDSFPNDDWDSDSEVDNEKIPEAGGVGPAEGVTGDGLTAFEEYRGFLIVGSVQRTKAWKKDLFYVDKDVQRLDSPLFTILQTFPRLDVRQVGQFEVDLFRNINSNNISRDLLDDREDPGQASGDHPPFTPVPGASFQRALWFQRGSCGGDEGFKDGPRDNRNGLVEVWGCVHIGVVETGKDGIRQTAAAGDDRGRFAVDKGLPHTVAITVGDPSHQATYENSRDPGSDDFIGRTFVSTGSDGILQVFQSALPGDTGFIEYHKGLPHSICIEAGTNGVADTAVKSDNDDWVFKDAKGVSFHHAGPLATPNESFLIEINLDTIDAAFGPPKPPLPPESDEQKQARLELLHNWKLAVVAHEGGHGVHIPHWSISLAEGHSPTSVMVNVMGGGTPPTEYDALDRPLIRLHLKHE